MRSDRIRRGGQDTKLMVDDAGPEATGRRHATTDVDPAASGGAHPGPFASQAESARQRDVARTRRAGTSAVKAQTAATLALTEVDRFRAAEQRDEAAHAHDIVSAARDLAAEGHDRSTARKDTTPEAAAARERAADDRIRAAIDRRRAAGDRESSRLDREQLRAVMTEGHVDDLTGTYRRTMGRIVLQAEIDRAHRSTDRLVLAFVDVDGLKAHNDLNGHAAGDELLLEVVASIRSKLRPYDPIVRFGGDEFICALIDVDVDSARARFGDVGTSLQLAYPGASISVGLAELQPDDTLEDLIARGDEAVYSEKQPR